MNSELLSVLDNLSREKGIDREVILEAIESALVSAARKSLGSLTADVTATIDRATGTILVIAEGKELANAEFGRIAAQTAKQVIFHKIREAERSVIFTEFSPRAGTMLTGTMQRFDRGAIVVDIGKTEAVLPKREQSPKETFRPGDRVSAYCIEVNKTAKGPQIILSRSHPSFVLELFKMEVPEIGQGIVEIKSVSREAGDRAKVAVYTKDEKIDCVGACVGMRGTRVKDIVRELHGEKIDIIRWSPKLEEYVAAALSPAKVVEIQMSPDRRQVQVIVDEDQLSLAIGKRGQNVRLAAKLVGVDIDVRTRVQLEKLAQWSVGEVAGIGPKMREALEEAGFNKVDRLARSSVEDLTRVKGIGEKIAERLIEEAKKFMTQLEAEVPPPAEEIAPAAPASPSEDSNANPAQEQQP